MLLNALFENVLDYPPAPGPSEVAADTPDPREAVEKKLPGSGGIYLLTDADDRVIQLASAGHLRRALQMRLRPPTADEDSQLSAIARRRADLSQIVRKIWWRTAYSGFEIMYHYWRIARQLMPQAYLKQLAFGPCWFVHVDPAARIPRFAIGKTLRAGAGTNLGPIATHQDATRFVQIMQDAFDLCRCDQILEQTPHGQPCAYFDMGKCPAPCNGSIPMSTYREQINKACSFATGQREQHYFRWEQQMREAADRMAFEQAAAVKHRLERARALEHQAYALTHPIDAFNYLILQRGKGRTRVQPFYVRAGRIHPATMVKLKELDEAADKWIRDMTKLSVSEDNKLSDDQIDGQAVSEQIWLISHFLFKKETPGLFIQISQLPDPKALAEQVRQTFAVRRREQTTEDADQLPPSETHGQNDAGR